DNIVNFRRLVEGLINVNLAAVWLTAEVAIYLKKSGVKSF
ncbi:hypothetical protein ACO22_07627, partial [Paracoccidioides brasiliensis]